MSYREEDGKVVLTMSREDYELLVTLSGAGIARLRVIPEFHTEGCLMMLNRLNQGNPNYTPYQVAEKGDVPQT
jgi:hypothetical protein